MRRKFLAAMRLHHSVVRNSGLVWHQRISAQCRVGLAASRLEADPYPNDRGVTGLGQVIGEIVAVFGLDVERPHN